MNYERILSQHEIVRTFIFFNGDVQRLKTSLNSVQNQTYPFIKIFIILLTTEHIIDFITSTDSSNVEFVYKSELADKLKSTDGSYIQFVLPGDKLLPNKIKNCVELLHSNMSPNVIIPQQTFTHEENLPEHFTIEMRKMYRATPTNGKELIRFISNNQQIILSGLSRTFYKQSAFINVSWVDLCLNYSNDNSLNIESRETYFFVNSIINQMVLIWNEELIERGVESWTQQDLSYYNKLMQLIADQLR